MMQHARYFIGSGFSALSTLMQFLIHARQSNYNITDNDYYWVTNSNVVNNLMFDDCGEYPIKSVFD